MPGPWEKYGGTSAPAAPAMGDPIVKPAPVDKPKPYEPPSGYTGTPEGLTPIPGGPADKPPAKDPRETEGERKAAGFVIRAQGANDNFSKVQKIGPRSLIGQGIADNFPKIANQFSDADRQQMEQAQREF